MFFVGATEQLITLILTVSLPFIFFLSGNHEIKATQQPLLSHQTNRKFHISILTLLNLSKFILLKFIRKTLKLKNLIL